MIWFGLGKEHTWLWFRKDHVYSLKQQSSSDEKDEKVFNSCSVIFMVFFLCLCLRIIFSYYTCYQLVAPQFLVTFLLYCKSLLFSSVGFNPTI